METKNKLLKIASVVVDVDYQDEDINLWITAEVQNLTDRVLQAELTVVLQQEKAKEKIVIVEPLEPGSNVMESVLRIVEIRQWNNVCEHHLMLGLRTEGNVQDTKEKKFLAR